MPIKGRKYPFHRHLSRDVNTFFSLPGPGFCGVAVGYTYLRCLLAMIASAKSSIFCSVYDFGSVSRSAASPVRLVFEALRDACLRGVDVCVLISSKFTSPHHCRRVEEAARLLAQGGASVRKLKTKNFLHAKFFVVDGEMVLIGSHNLTLASLLYNREASIFLSSKEIAEKLIQKFTTF